MSKKIIAIGMILIFICVGLSGCNDQSNKIELVEYSVKTIRGSVLFYETLADDFVYSESATAYLINGTVKNNANKMIDFGGVYEKDKRTSYDSWIVYGLGITSGLRRGLRRLQAAALCHYEGFGVFAS